MMPMVAYEHAGGRLTDWSKEESSGIVIQTPSRIGKRKEQAVIAF